MIGIYKVTNKINNYTYLPIYKKKEQRWINPNN